MNWDSRRRRAGDSEGGAEDSGGADWDGPGPWREPEAEEEPTIGGIAAEAALDDDEDSGVEGSSDETSALGKRHRRAQSRIIPAKNGMLMSSALVDGRNTEGGGALENGKASIISAPRLRSRPMRCN
jgi:hypothetical protein